MSKKLHNYIVEMSKAYQVENSHNLFMLMGKDFAFKDADSYFHNSDQMIQYYNDHEGFKYNVELIYSTPSQYIDAIASQKQIVFWPTRYEDMFPYKDTQFSYWTGYFSSRPHLKSLIRRASSFYHASNDIYSLAGIHQATSRESADKMRAANFDF
jgi:hypothetical protein